MACRLVGAKPLSEPILDIVTWILRNRLQWNWNQNPEENSLKKMRLKMSSAKFCPFRLGPWWRHQMETFSALLAICAGNSPAAGEFPAQRPVTRSFDVFFDLCLNKRLRKQWWGWWFETLSRPLWRHYNAQCVKHDIPFFPAGGGPDDGRGDSACTRSQFHATTRPGSISGSFPQRSGLQQRHSWNQL